MVGGGVGFEFPFPPQAPISNSGVAKNRISLMSFIFMVDATLKKWWAIMDSNHWPLACKSYALLFPHVDQCSSLKVFIPEPVSSCRYLLIGAVVPFVVLTPQQPLLRCPSCT